MSKSPFFLSAALMALTFGGPLWAESHATATGADMAGDAEMAESVGIDTVVATVGGSEITVGHMLMTRMSLPQQYQSLPDDQLWDGILEQLIRQETLAQSDASASESARVRLGVENERRTLVAAQAIIAAAEAAATDARVQEVYEAKYLNGDTGVEWNAAHILLETEEEAQAVIAELEGGADFAAVAREKSTGPSAPNGGALGWFGAGSMVGPFEAAVQGLEAGEVSAPVQTQFGWHVIKLEETRDMEAPALEAVRGEIVNEIQSTAVEAHIETLVSEAAIERMPKENFDTSILSNSGLLNE